MTFSEDELFLVKGSLLNYRSSLDDIVWKYRIIGGASGDEKRETKEHIARLDKKMRDLEKLEEKVQDEIEK